MHTSQPPPPDEATLDALAATVHRDVSATLGAADRLHHAAAGDGLGAVAVILAAVDRLIAAVIGMLQAADHQQVIAAHGLTGTAGCGLSRVARARTRGCCWPPRNA